MFNLPLIFNTDSYKFSHYLGYPPGTTEVYSYKESRGGDYRDVVVMGSQAVFWSLLKFDMTREDILEAQDYARLHGVPFNLADWDYLLATYGEYDSRTGCTHLRRLPIRIEGLPDGTVTRTREPLFAVYNTDPRVPWLTSYLETALLRVWYPITVASRVFAMRKSLQPVFKETGAASDGFAVLDFGSRGVETTESSIVGGLGHLASFIGSDNTPAIYFANKLYGSKMAAFSVPATEHSVMTAWTPERELASFEYLIDNMVQENGTLSVVSDSWDIYAATKKWVSLKDKIINKNVTLVVRPDSGVMNEVLPAVLRDLIDGFGTVQNSKGYGVLKNVKVLWGDGINERTVVEPFLIAKSMGISAESIITGSGGGILQTGIDRDTMKSAFKASNVVVNRESIPIAKQPITDPGKVSKKGKFTFPHVYYDNGNFGEMIKLDDIRANITKEIEK